MENCGFQMVQHPWDSCVPRPPVIIRVGHADHIVQVHSTRWHFDAHNLAALHLVNEEHSQHLHRENYQNLGC